MLIISIIVGCLMVYLSQPKLKPVIVYPTLDNLDKIQYKDSASHCYSYKPEMVKCPSSSNEIFNIPIQ